MRLAIILEREELNALQPGVIVEMWKKSKTLTGKRKIKAEFTDEEIKNIEKLYKLSCRWYLQTGVPNEHAMSMEDYQFFIRVTNFFALEL